MDIHFSPWSVCPIPVLTDRKNSREPGKKGARTMEQLKASGIQMEQASRSNREQQCIRELEAEVRTLHKQTG